MSNGKNSINTIVKKINRMCVDEFNGDIKTNATHLLDRLTPIERGVLLEDVVNIHNIVEHRELPISSSTDYTTELHEENIKQKNTQELEKANSEELIKLRSTITIITLKGLLYGIIIIFVISVLMKSLFNVEVQLPSGLEYFKEIYAAIFKN